MPDHKKHDTYISLGATSGMRSLRFLLNTVKSISLKYLIFYSLSEFDLNTTNQIISFIEVYFNESKYHYENSSQIQILSQKDEIIDVWIPINYFLNKFTIVTILFFNSKSSN